MFALFSFSENITQKNYLITFDCVDMLSRKSIYLRKILTMDLDYITFYWILTGNLLDSDL